MQDSLPSGIRCMHDAENEAVVATVREIDSALLPAGKRFFFDTSDCDDFFIGGKHLYDAFGWIVPIRDADRFEQEYLNIEDRKDNSFGEEWYRSVSWEDRDGVPVPVIE